METLGDLAKQIPCSLEELLAALYRLVRDNSQLCPMAIVNPGCSEADLHAAEERIGHALHPLHHVLLRLSNGGELPFTTGDMQAFGAAVYREAEWRMVGPLPPEDPALPPPLIDIPESFPPFLIGMPVEGPYRVDKDAVIEFASGYDGAFCAYVRSDPERIVMAHLGEAAYPVAANFAEFLARQRLVKNSRTPAFVEFVRAALE